MVEKTKGSRKGEKWLNITQQDPHELRNSTQVGKDRRKGGRLAEHGGRLGADSLMSLHQEAEVGVMDQR